MLFSMSEVQNDAQAESGKCFDTTWHLKLAYRRLQQSNTHAAFTHRLWKQEIQAFKSILQRESTLNLL